MIEISYNKLLKSIGIYEVEEMATYEEFAKVYNTFMEDVPYSKWVAFIERTMNRYLVTPKIMCDLGCGTGIMCRLFAKKGIEMIGIDSSQEMLMEAMTYQGDEGASILYLNQDMRTFELYGTVDVIYSSCDSINYLLHKEEVLETFRWVNNYLEPNGLFIFDINTVYKYENILNDQTFAYQGEQAAYIWENYFDKKEMLNEFTVNFFIKEKKDYYKRTEEIHYQRAYEIEEIKRLLEEAHLELLGIYDDYTDRPLVENTLRATFVVREKGKERNK